MQRFLKDRRAFTSLELAAVVGVVGLIAGFLITELVGLGDATETRATEASATAEKAVGTTATAHSGKIGTAIKALDDKM